MSRKDRISLKAFAETVEQQLAALSADELRTILRAMAQETPPSERQAFLDKLKPVQATATLAQKVSGQEDLLADIDDFVRELSSAPKEAEYWEERHGWDDDYYDDEDSLGPYEEFVEPLTALFERAQAAFDYGDLSLARAAYQKLFEGALQVEDDYGRGMRADDLSGVDIAEAQARYLRAIYEIEPPARRAKTVFEQMRQAQSWLVGSRPTLDDVIQISAKPLPDEDLFLRDWIAFLRKQSGGDADAWLREAIRLSQGTPGLEELARAEGKKRPRAYLDWLTALEGEGKHREALAAAQESFKKLPFKLPIRAAIADHLCAAAARLNEPEALRTGRWEAFTASPTLARVLDLWEAAPTGEERAALMEQAARHVKDYLAHPPRRQETVEAWGYGDTLEESAWIDKSVLAHAYLFAGDWDAARQLAARGPALGWSSSDNPQGLVVPFFLALLSGKAPGALPPNLAKLWPERLQRSIGFGSWSEESEGEPGLLQRLERAYAELFPRASLSESEQASVLSWCLDVAAQRTDAIVGGQHRGSYDKAAVLTAACAEVQRLRGKDKEAEAMLDEVRNRFPRHRAFQAELDAATQRVKRSRR